MKYYAQLGEREYGFEVVHTEAGTIVHLLDAEGEGLGHETRIDFASVHSNLDTGGGLYSIIAGGKSYQLFVELTDMGFRMLVWRDRYDMQVLTEREWRLQKVAPRQVAHTGEITVNSPMPGLVKSVLVAVGDVIKQGQRLLVLEAMKMENDISSPRDGHVKAVHAQAGQIVESGKPLVSIES